MIRGPIPRILAVALATFLAIALLYPIVIVLLRGVVIDGEFSTANIDALLADPGIPNMVRNTILITFGGAALGLIFGIPLAITTTLLPARRFERKILQLIPLVPLTIPALVGAIGWLFLLSPRAGWLNVIFRRLLGDESGEGPLSAHVTPIIIWVMGLYIVPFVYTIMASSISRLSTELIESYRVFGCSALSSMWKVITGPLRPALFASISLAIVQAFSQFSVPLILRIDVLTTYMHRQVKFLGNYGGAAIAAIPLFLIGVILTLWQIQMTKQNNRYATVSGKGSGVRVISFGRLQDRLMKGSAYGYFLFSGLLPLGAILLVSFLSFWRPSITVDDLIIDNYLSVWNNSLVRIGTKNSLLLAITCSIAAAFLVLVVIVIAQRVRGVAPRLSYFFANLPLGIPHVLLGLAFLVAFISPPFILYGTIWILVLAYVVAFLPIAMRNIGPLYQQIGIELEEAAVVSGSTWTGALRKITGPLIMPGFAASAALLFVLIFREFPIAAFISTPRVNVLSMSLLGYNDGARWSHVAVLSVLISIVSSLGIVISNVVAGRYEIATGHKPPRSRRKA